MLRQGGAETGQHGAGMSRTSVVDPPRLFQTKSLWGEPSSCWTPGGSQGTCMCVGVYLRGQRAESCKVAEDLASYVEALDAR